MELSWGKCTIKIGKLQSSGEAPSSWIDIPTPGRTDWCCYSQERWTNAYGTVLR